MSISVTCPGCQSVYPVPENLAGKTIRCKKCGEMMAVTAPAAPAAPPAKPLIAAPVAAPVAAAVPAAKPLPAQPVARVAEDQDDGEDVITAKPVRGPRDEEDDEEDAPRGRKAPPKKKGMGMILVLGGVLGLLVVGAVGVGALFATGVLGGKSDDDAGDLTQTNAATPPGPTGPAVVTPPGVLPGGGGATTPVPPPDGTQVASPTLAPPANGGTTTPVAPITPIAPLTSPGSPRASTPPPMRDMPDQITLNKCKHAAVLIKAENTRGGGGTGSGWFGLEENLIFTNAHVLNMDAPGSPKPAKVTVWIDPGTPQEKEIPHSRLEILAVDRDMDLAVMRVMNESGLPPPLQIRPSAELRDLERLVVLGYPGGKRLSDMNRSTRPPAVTVGEARVQTLRRDDNGNIYSVQMQSNVVHGNSGGPIVDADGNVVGVAVRVDLDRQGRFTGIAYGVPTEYVNGLLAGRVADVEFGQAYRAGGKVHIPVTANCLDPMRRLKAVGIGYWVGDAAVRRPRPPGPERTGQEPGDSNYAEVALAYKPGKDKCVATGEIVLPELPAGRAYWAQPYYSNALVTRYWLAGNPVKLSGPPVDREPADLIVRYKVGTRRPLTLSNSSALDEFEEGEGADKSERLMLESELTMTELVQKPGDTGAVASLLLNYEKFALKGHIGPRSLDDLIPKDLRGMFAQGIKQVQGLGHVNKDGEIYKTQTNTRATGRLGPLFKIISDEGLESLQGASIKLPNTKANPGFTWTDKKNYRLHLLVADGSELLPPADGPPGRPTPPPARKAAAPRAREYRYQQEVKYTYLGSRERAGHKEAVVQVEGTITTAPGAKANEGASGVLKGWAYIDLATGTVLDAEVEKELEIDTSSEGIKKRISGINKYKLSRGSATTN